MNQTHTHTHTHAGPADWLNEMLSIATGESEGRVCASPYCHNLVSEPWEETGTLCGSCAIEGDLADRDARWDRLFSTIH